MKRDAIECKNSLLKYMVDYLEYRITKEEYYDFSETCYSDYAKVLKLYYPYFYEVFADEVPNICLYYIEEPGLNEFTREKLFRESIERVYEKLKNL